MSFRYPGYTSVIPKSAATIAEVLKLNGYSTSAFGTFHNVPVGKTVWLGLSTYADGGTADQ